MTLSASIDQGAPARSGLLLVVDDSESTRYVLSTWLRRAGYNVLEATTGEQALGIASTEPLDLVVLDVNLPDMSGFAVCENIKSQRKTALPVLHVSATAVQTTDRSEGLRRGADGYLVEPIEREELLASVAALLRGASAERTAVRLAWRLRRLNDATLAVNGAETLETLVAIIVKEACVLFETAAVVGVVVDDWGLTMACEPNREPVVLHRQSEVTTSLRVAVGEQLLVPGSSLHGLLPASGAKAYVCGNLDITGAHQGVLLIRSSDDIEHRVMDEETMVVLSQFTRAASITIKNMRAHDVERRIALTFQRSLMPDRVPAIPGIELAARYQASDEHNEVGGDFYEIFSLGENLVAVAVGDVMGHSLAAATVMAEIRSGARAYMLEGHGPAATVERMNLLLQRFHPDVIATVCCAVYDRRNGRCELANAGHLPGLIARTSGTSFLPGGGPPLGIAARAEPPCVFTLSPGDVLLLYTDGLVERRGEPIDAGLERLERAATLPAGDLDEFCNRVLLEAGPVSLDDDIAILAMRRPW